jgi:hypothetical protein
MKSTESGRAKMSIKTLEEDEQDGSERTNE